MDVWLPQSWLRHAGSRWWGLPSPYVNQLKRLMRRNAHWCHAFILALQGWVLTSYSRTYGRFGFTYNWWGPTLHASLWLIDAHGSAESKAITLMPSTGVWQNTLPCSRMMGWDPKVGMAYGSPKQQHGKRKHGPLVSGADLFHSVSTIIDIGCWNSSLLKLPILHPFELIGVFCAGSNPKVFLIAFRAKKFWVFIPVVALAQKLNIDPSGCNVHTSTILFMTL